MAYTNEQLGKALEDLTIAYNNFKANFTDAAIEAMTTTIIADIKQDAKDYIASELAAQKADLELAIEQAKLAINNYVASGKSEFSAFNEAKKQELLNLVQQAKNDLEYKTHQAEVRIQNAIDDMKNQTEQAKGEIEEAINEANTQTQEYAGQLESSKNIAISVIEQKKDEAIATIEAKVNAVSSSLINCSHLQKKIKNKDMFINQVFYVTAKDPYQNDKIVAIKLKIFYSPYILNYFNIESSLLTAKITTGNVDCIKSLVKNNNDNTTNYLQNRIGNIPVAFVEGDFKTQNSVSKEFYLLDLCDLMIGWSANNSEYMAFAKRVNLSKETILNHFLPNGAIRPSVSYEENPNEAWEEGTFTIDYYLQNLD